MTNKKSGNAFETFFCNVLFFNGFWVHNLAQNQAGQPADVIAVKNGKAYLIDCKVCSGKGFPFSRIEENQDSSMRLWAATGNGTGWFALYYGSKTYMVSHVELNTYRNLGKAYMSGKNIEQLPTIEEWVRQNENGNK